MHVIPCQIKKKTTKKPNNQQPHKNHKQTNKLKKSHRKQITNENSNSYWIPCLRLKPKKGLDHHVTYHSHFMCRINGSIIKKQKKPPPLLAIVFHLPTQWQMNNHHPTTMVIYGTSCWLFPSFQWQHQKNIFICSCLKGWRQNRSVYPSLYPFSKQIEEFLLGSTQLIYKV